MRTKVAINGFGRIGRLVFAALIEQGLFRKKYHSIGEWIQFAQSALQGGL